MKSGHLKRSFLIFLFVISFFLIFKSIYILASPGVVNATTINITSDADLNLTSFSPFVDGKIIAGQGNRSNLTAWDTWSDGEWQTNPTWVWINVSQNDAVGAIHRVDLSDNVINITSQTSEPASSGSRTSIVRNINVSVPRETGLVASWWQRIPLTATGSGVDGGACFVDNIPLGNLTGAVNKDCDGSGGHYAYAIHQVNPSIPRNAYLTSGGLISTAVANDSWVHMNWWFNWTHQRLVVNYTEGASQDSGLDVVSANLSSGVFIFFLSSGSTQVISMQIANFSIANVTDMGFGQPLNLTPSTIQTGVLNNTALITKAKVLNQTLANRESKANFSVFDSNHANSQNIYENTLTSLSSTFTGIGFNVTLYPKELYSASEFTSFLIEYELDNIPPFISFGLNNELNNSVLGRNWVVLNFSYSETYNKTFAIHNGTTDWEGVNAKSSYFSYNFTNLNDGNYTFFGSITDNADNRNFTTNRTIFIDTVVPLVFGNSSLATTVNTAGNISVNVSDSGSNISSVTVEVTNDTGSNGDKQNYTMSFLSGSNIAGSSSVWSYSYTSDGARVFTARFWATDFAGNTYKTPDDTLEWTATVSSPPSGGQTGGGAPSTFTVVQVQNVTKGFCGDGECQTSAGEDVLNCGVDCGGFSGINLGAIPKGILFVMGLAFVYLVFIRGKIPKGLKSVTLKKRSKWIPEGWNDGKRLV